MRVSAQKLLIAMMVLTLRSSILSKMPVHITILVRDPRINREERPDFEYAGHARQTHNLLMTTILTLERLEGHLKGLKSTAVMKTPLTFVVPI
jgi:hypothetical protein